MRIEDCGDGNYVSVCENATKEEYISTLNTLEQEGWQKYADQGQGLGEMVFATTYTKDKWAVTVTYIEKSRKLYQSARFNKPLPERLIYKEEYVSENKPGAKTSLHMSELWWFGNSFVVQLKNGHFIISDGGMPEDTAYLVDYLEALAPQGEKPVVEAWLISHAHGDHCGALRGFMERQELFERISVEGIYYSIVGERLYEKDEYSRLEVAQMQWVSKKLHAPIYRPHIGERYYFSDITVDVIHTHEQLPKDARIGDCNGTSTWFMLGIEGQKILLPGDGDWACMQTIMANYDSEYFNLDVMALMHHGFDVREEFTEFCKVKTLLLTVRNDTPVGSANENTHLKERVEEYFPWGDGTKVLTFPYQVGSYETLPKKKWIYHDESARPEQQINIYRYGPGHQKKEIRTLRIADHGLSEHADRLLAKIREHLPLPFARDGQMIELRIDREIESERKYRIFMEDPTGWVLSAIDEENLYLAIDTFVNEATWSEKGFKACEIK